MLDIKALRADPEAAREALGRRSDPDVPELLEKALDLDRDRRDLIQEVEGLRARRNETSEEIGRLKREGRDAASLIEEMRDVADRIDALDEQLADVEDVLEATLLRVPNLPAPRVPEGGEEAYRVLRTWGEPSDVEVEDGRPHWEVGERLGILDLERGAKVAGSGFPLLVGEGARLQRALVAFMLDLHLEEHGYEEVAPPYLVNRETMVGTGQLPKFERDMYRTEPDDLFLVPTAEVPVTNLHAGEILEPDEMPRRYVAYTPCFRREAGSAGRDTRGLLRVHQFDKVELMRFERPDASEAALEELTRHAERVLEALELPHRRILLATGDLGFANALTYDLEVWAAGVGEWLEVSSCSSYGDYQARRADLRYRPSPGVGPEFLHTLNGSGVAIARTLVALLENGQTADGRIRLPDVLHSYMGRTHLEGP
ncbi:MAG: serine--tRNA ligase [Gemmatimonadota bacterium]